MQIIKSLVLLAAFIESIASRVNSTLYKSATKGLDKVDGEFADEATRHHNQLKFEAARHLKASIKLDEKVDYLRSIINPS